MRARRIARRRARRSPRPCRIRRRAIALGREADVVEALRHARADLALQHRRGVVGRRGARERAPHRARIDLARVGRRKARVSAASTKPASAAANAVGMRKERRMRRAVDLAIRRARQCMREPTRRRPPASSVSRVAGDHERRNVHVGDVARAGRCRGAARASRRAPAEAARRARTAARATRRASRAPVVARIGFPAPAA